MGAMAIKRGVSLKKYNTFKLGGTASFFVSVKSLEELVESLKFAKQKKLKTFILGGGSNVLIEDKNFNGLVIRMEITGVSYSGSLVKACAGENWDKFVLKTLKQKLYGLENLSGIPGSVGATPIQNVGAYGTDVSKFIKSVKVLDKKTLKTRVLSKKDCRFLYRDSFFKSNTGQRLVILEVEFSLKKNFKPNISYKDLASYFVKRAKPGAPEVRAAVLSIRAKKFPNLRKYGTAGSFFKNPIISVSHFRTLKEKYSDIPGFKISTNKVKVPLAWILDKVCKLKGYKTKKVGLYKKQPLVLVNFGNAKHKDVLKLKQKIEKLVYKKTKIKIYPEVTFVK